MPELTCDELSRFAIDQSNGTLSDVPAWIRELDGRGVHLVGEMWVPTGPADGVQQFDLTDVERQRHRPHQPPLVQQFIMCRSTTTLPYYPNVVRVTGVLHVSVQRDGDRIASLYQCDVLKVEPMREASNGRPASE